MFCFQHLNLKKVNCGLFARTRRVKTGYLKELVIKIFIWVIVSLQVKLSFMQNF